MRGGEAHEHDDHEVRHTEEVAIADHHEVRVARRHRASVGELLRDASEQHAHAERDDERFGLLLDNEEAVDEADEGAEQHRTQEWQPRCSCITLISLMAMMPATT